MIVRGYHGEMLGLGRKPGVERWQFSKADGSSFVIEVVADQVEREAGAFIHAQEAYLASIDTGHGLMNRAARGRA
jgi:hypothetical protein